MKLKNDFEESTRRLFEWTTECWWCSLNHANCLHHILGRVSNSPFNCAPLNNFSCHIGNGKLSQFEIRKKLLQKTLRFLLENGYKLTKLDKDFKKKYSQYYD